MANLVPIPTWEDIYEIGIGDYATGGPGGTSNQPHQDLANRTQYLYELITQSNVLYVDYTATLGAGDGTSGNPFKTIQEAVDTIKAYNTIKQNVIKLADGTHGMTDRINLRDKNLSNTYIIGNIDNPANVLLSWDWNDFGGVDGDVTAQGFYITHLDILTDLTTVSYEFGGFIGFNAKAAPKDLLYELFSFINCKVKIIKDVEILKSTTYGFLYAVNSDKCTINFMSNIGGYVLSNRQFMNITKSYINTIDVNPKNSYLSIFNSFVNYISISSVISENYNYLVNVSGSSINKIEIGAVDGSALNTKINYYLIKSYNSSIKYISMYTGFSYSCGSNDNLDTLIYAINSIINFIYYSFETSDDIDRFIYAENSIINAELTSTYTNSSIISDKTALIEDNYFIKSYNNSKVNIQFSKECSFSSFHDVFYSVNSEIKIFCRYDVTVDAQSFCKSDKGSNINCFIEENNKVEFSPTLGNIDSCFYASDNSIINVFGESKLSKIESTGTNTISNFLKSENNSRINVSLIDVDLGSQDITKFINCIDNSEINFTIETLFSVTVDDNFIDCENNSKVNIDSPISNIQNITINGVGSSSKNIIYAYRNSIININSAFSEIAMNFSDTLNILIYSGMNSKVNVFSAGNFTSTITNSGSSKMLYSTSNSEINFCINADLSISNFNTFCYDNNQSTIKLDIIHFYPNNITTTYNPADNTNFLSDGNAIWR